MINVDMGAKMYEHNVCEEDYILNYVNVNVHAHVFVKILNI